MTESYASLYIDYDSKGYSIGLSVFEPYGVRGWIGEFYSQGAHPYSAVDQALHMLFIAETPRLIISASSERYFRDIESNFSHFRYEYRNERFDLHEQNTLLSEVFALRSLFTPIEHLGLTDKPLASLSLVMFAHMCHMQGWRGYAQPHLLSHSLWMALGNNALEQMDIVTSDPQMSSIANIFLTMATPMGKRLGRFRLFMPIRDRKALEHRYDMIESIRPHTQFFRETLGRLADMEKAWWEIQHGFLDKIDPFLSQIEVCNGIHQYVDRHQLRLKFQDDWDGESWRIELKNRYKERQWIESQTPIMHEIIEWIARLDVACTQAISADRYKLVRPNLIDSEERFVQISALRHLLVEKQGVAYVPNDIVLGNRDYLDLPYPDSVMLDSKVHDGATVRGVLLYGINSSGKSSLMKSIGIAVTLAQAGFFVPAKVMKFSLFDGVYTRIKSRDNVAKSLSTFGVEMLELNTIFEQATARSLVLGDEISHGTETLSAVAIVASTIMELSQKGCLFLMTTHLHQLSMIPELSRLREVVHLHLGVRYDEASDRLIYDRVLKSGRGSSIYGLEFAESLHMNPSFLTNAGRLREHLAKEYDVLELGNQKEYIKRYREVVACECVVCGALIRNTQKNIHAKEHHHLIPLCDTHARQIAQGKIKPRGFIITSQGLRFEYETQLKED